jgi:hypothetical protein
LHFVPVFLTDFYWSQYPNTRSCPHLNFCKVINYWLSPQIVPRHCTSAHLTNYCMVTQYQPLRTLVPRYAYKPESLYLDGKNRAMLHSFRPQKNCILISGSCLSASIRSATFTHFIAGPSDCLITYSVCS